MNRPYPFLYNPLISIWIYGNHQNTLKDFFHQFHHKKEIFDLQKRHNNGLDLANKSSFFNNYTIDVFLFVTAIILLMVTPKVLYIICKHTKLTSLVTSLTLQQLRKVGTVTKQEHVSITYDIECICKNQWYTICMLRFIILGIVVFIGKNARILKLFRGQLFSNSVKIMLFISDAQYYVPVKLCRAAASIHLFKITGKLTPKHVKLKRNILLDVIELDWKEVNMTLNENMINLPDSVIILPRDKFKIRCIVK